MTDNHFLSTIFTPENFKKEDLEMVFSPYKRVEFAKNDILIPVGSTATEWLVWLTSAGSCKALETVDSETPLEALYQ